MRFKLMALLAMSGGLLVACSNGPNLPFSTRMSAEQATSPDRATTRLSVLNNDLVCPPGAPCCVAITGTSNVTVGDDTFNFEINTAANSPSGIGRVNFVDTAGTNNPNDDIQQQFTILETRCIIENGMLVGAEVDVTFDTGTDVDATFTLRGTPPGGSNSHLQVNSLTAVNNTGTTPFPSFNATDATFAQNSTQNVFPDTNCDGVPNPGLSRISTTPL